MVRKVKTIAGVFETEQEAIAAIEELLQRGYRKDEISVIGKKRRDVDHVSTETGAAVEESAATGAITGGALGGVTGLLAGAGALAIPGLGPIIAAGPIAATFLGALTGVGIGGLAGALIGMGISDDEAVYYENSVKEGKILVLIEDGYADSRNDRNYIYDVDQELPPVFEIRPDEERKHGIDEVIPGEHRFPGSGYKSCKFGSTIDEDLPSEKDLTLEKDSSLESNSSVEKGSSLRNANNGSMARNYEEMRRLGNEMEQNKTGQELREENLKPDPLQ